jgi:ABC-2 type transport system ATP-binding protein
MTENKKFRELSKGMKAKLALIISLSTGGELFIFDEPTSGLDPKVRHAILEEIEKIKKEKNPAILFSSHNMLDVERLADRIILLDKGRILLDENKGDLLKNWKRIEFKSDKPVEVGNYPGIFSTQVEGKIHYKIICEQFSEELMQSLIKQAITNPKVLDMSLEEIFLENTKD